MFTKRSPRKSCRPSFQPVSIEPAGSIGIGHDRVLLFGLGDVIKLNDMYIGHNMSVPIGLYVKRSCIVVHRVASVWGNAAFSFASR